MVQVNRENTETIEEEGIYYHQRGHTNSHEDILRQYLSMQRALSDFVTGIEGSDEKGNEDLRTGKLHDAVQKEFKALTKNITESQEITPGDNFKEGIDTRNIEIMDNSVLRVGQENSNNSDEWRGPPNKMMR